ncbi:sensor histidine kinase [Actinokineospora sp.]|uniref:sensor histidine kinase n=1 Tax=Actinokineospora sp. TaxID=1872133 RepID=UPI004038457C
MQAEREVDAWHRTVGGWHVVFGVLAALTVILTFVAEQASAARTAATLVLLTALCGWYWRVGAPALAEDRHRAGVLYVAVAIPLAIALFTVNLAGSLMLFVLYPHIWRLLPLRGAMIATAVTVVSIGLSGFTRSEISSRSVVETLALVAALLVTSVLMGLWINKIIVQSTQRADLVSALETTRAELAAVSHDAGVLAERERLAREIHDTLAQGFTSILMLLQAMDSEITRDPDAARRRVAQLDQTARDNLAEARTLVALLAPTHLESASLSETLRRLVDQVGRELGISATLVVSGAPRVLPTNHEVVLLRSTQEALANVRKHADAAGVVVLLRYQDERVELEVRDDGRGFDQAAPPNGFGLAGMRARVLQVGGTIEVDGARGSGVAVRIVLPCPVETVESEPR